jgi:hypothetical protein
LDKESLMTRKALAYAAGLQQQKAEDQEQRIQQQLTPLLEAVTDADDACRRAAIEHVLRVCLPIVISKLIDRLAELLGRGGAARRSRAIASFSEFGPQALPALIQRFKKARGPATQTDVLAALRQMSPGLTSDRIADLLLDVGILGLFATGGTVKRGITATIAHLQRDLVRPTPKANPERVKEPTGSPGGAPDAASGLPDVNVT